MKNLFLALVIFFIVVFSSYSQDNSAGRLIWPDDAHVSGDFGADNFSTTGTVRAASGVNAFGGLIISSSLVLGPSETAINIVEPVTNTFLGYDDTNNQFIVIPFQTLIDAATISVSGISSIDDINDVSAPDSMTFSYNLLSVGADGSVWYVTDTIYANLSSLAKVLDVSMTSTPAHGTVLTYDADTGKIDFKDNISAEIDSAVIGDSTSYLYGDGSNITNVAAADSSGLTIDAKVGEAAGLSVGDIVYIAEDLGSNIVVELADKDNVLAEHYLGMAAEAKTFGQTVNVRISGELSGVDVSAATDGDPIWLGDDGGMLFSRPSTGGAVLVGVVKNAAINGEVLLYRSEQHYIGIASAEDYEIRLGDDVGAASDTEFKITDTSDNNIFQVTNNASAEVIINGVSFDVDNLSPTRPILKLSAAGIMEASEESAGGASALADLTDVNISGPTLNEVLTYDGANWINQGASGGGGGSGSAELIFDYIIAATNSVNAASADIVCDGTADNESIQYAVDLVSSNNGGSILLLAGNYRFDAAVTIASGSNHISIYGQRGGIYTGAQTTVLDRRYDTAGTNTVGVVDINGGNGVALYDITVNGNDGYFSGNYNGGISIRGSAYHAHLERIWVYDCGGAGFFVYGYESSLYICRASGCGVGFNLYNFLSGNQGYFLNCTAINNTGSGFTWNGTTNPSEIQFIGCRAEDNGGWGFSGYDNSIIDSCKITGNTNGGMYISDNNIVTNNYIYDGTIGVWLDGSSNVVSSNYISTNDDYGIRGDTLGYYNQIHDNRIVASGEYGIFLYNCDYTIIQNNTFIGISGTGHGGIRLNTSADNTQILNNMFYNNNLGVEINPGVSGDPLNTIIKGNSFLASTNMDIYIHNGNTVIIEDNVFNSAGTATRLIYITTTATPGILFANNIVKGTYPLFIDGGGVMEQIYNTSSPAYGARADVFIMSASASTKIGFATDDPTTITNVITVSSGATTDPIANNWATWSDPALKENIEVVDAKEQKQVDSFVDNMDIIKFNWRYPYPAPTLESFTKNKDIKEPSTEYEKALLEYEQKKVAWNSIRNRYKSWAVDLSTIPDDVAAYDEQGNKRGYNINQLVIRMLASIKELKAQNVNLQDRIKILESER